MSGAETGSINSSGKKPETPSPRLAVTLINIAAIFALLFFSRFVFYADLHLPMNTEECHTGAAAREILRHGFEFPIEQYTPEYYENSILVAIPLTAVSVAIFGQTPFAVKLVPVLFSFGCLLLGWALLAQNGYRKGAWFFVLCFIFAPLNLVMQTVDAVGNHIIGLFFGMLILYLFCHAVRRDRRAFHLFMFIAGFGLFAHAATLLFTAVCAVSWLLFFRRGEGGLKLKPGFRGLALGLACFALGAIPFIILLLKSDGQSVTSLLPTYLVQKQSFPGSHAPALTSAFLSMFDNNIPLLSVSVICYASIAWRSFRVVRGNHGIETRPPLDSVILVGAPMVLLAVLAVAWVGQQRYYTYLYPFLFIPVSMCIPLWENALRRNEWQGKLMRGATAVLLAFCITGNTGFFQRITSINGSTFARARALLADTERSYCYWRFGRSFEHYSDYSAGLLGLAQGIKEKCDRFTERGARMECYFGASAVYNSYEHHDEKYFELFGRDGARVAAMGIGERFDSKADDCLYGDLPGNLVGPCLLGYLERHEYELKYTGGIPCLEKTSGFIGYRDAVERKFIEAGGTLEYAAEQCGIHQFDICPVLISYCGHRMKKQSPCALITYSNAARTSCATIYNLLPN